LSRITSISLGSHETLGAGGASHTRRTTGSYRSNLSLHVGKRIRGGSLVSALRLLDLVQEGLDVRLGSWRSGHSRDTWLPSFSRWPPVSGSS